MDDDGRQLSDGGHLRSPSSPQNVTYTVKNSANKKESIKLLEDVSGFFRPGELNALMGKTGAWLAHRCVFP